jgi:acyl-CoA synthetase (AMP-forming)/AMP-acid ligase II
VTVSEPHAAAPPEGFDPETVCAMFEWRLDHDPDATFVMTPDGVARSYADIDARARALAVRLREEGVRPGDVVGLYLWNDPSWIVAVFACWWLGAGFAACGGQSPPSEAQRRFSLVEAPVVVAAADLDTADLATAGVRGSARRLVVVTPEGLAIDATGPVSALSSDEKHRPDPGEVAAVFFTSGTTGEAKPVVHRHGRLADASRATAGAYAKTPRFRPRVAPGTAPPTLSFNPFGHVAGVGRMAFRMYVGRPLLLVPKFDVAVVADLARRYPFDTLQLTPAMVHSLAYTDLDVDLGALKYVNSGTAPLPIATREAFEARYGVPVLQAYGSTEGGVTALERYDDALAGRRGPGSVGRVPEGIPVRIVDAEGNDVAPGAEGEILGRPDPAQSSVYRSSTGEVPFQLDAEGWYHTGDIGRLDEHGILYITGRVKEMMIVGGFNVYPGEVEDALRRVRGVRDAVVIALPDDRLGEVPVAGVVWAKGDGGAGRGRPDRFDRLAAELRKGLEAYKVPRQWFDLAEVPLTGNGKLDRAEATRLASRVLAASS